MNTAGIIGGLGPETTAEFYLRLIALCQASNDVHYPPIVIYNSPFPYDIEQEIIAENRNEERILPYLLEGLARLAQSGADFAVIPCNTVHFFLDELRRGVSIPVLSILDATADECRARGLRRVGVLGTRKTIEKRLYDGPLAERGIETLVLDEAGCSAVSGVIFRLLRGDRSEQSKAILRRAVGELKDRGAEAVILGCTDLQILLDPDRSGLPLIDTVEVMAAATADRILDSERGGTVSRGDLRARAEAIE
jgi:aspartate racemase